MPFLIGIENPQHKENLGTLWRSAYQLGALSIFTIGSVYKPQNSDTYKTWKQIPYYVYESIEKMPIPLDFVLVGVEQGGCCLTQFQHPKRAMYLLGNEGTGLTPQAKELCHQIVSIPSIRLNSYNVSMAGTIIMYDRMCKNMKSKTND